MTTSKTIAGLIGPTLVVMAVANLLNLGSLPALIEQASRDPALIYVSGILGFVAGLAIVRVHNRWHLDWPLLVTVLGWLALLGGVARMLFGIRLAPMASTLGQRTSFILAVAIALLVVGAFLSLKAYGRE
jgi:uncharacterized membrane protein HdeD (DUF308 family)